MAEDTDFAALYRTLRIAPACTPAQFRQAYRRAVARLHPDPRGGHGDVAELQELNRLYRAAKQFQRAHGRLPGAPTGESASPAFADVTDTPRASRPAASTAAAPGEAAPAGIDRLSRYFILLALLAIAVLALHALEDGGRDTAANIAAPPPPEADRHAAAQRRIVLGMEKAQVKAIQGKPLGVQTVRWDYGPSWIEFGCGGVVTDWYSSPLRPLRVAGPQPGARERESFAAAPPPGC